MPEEQKRIEPTLGELEPRHDVPVPPLNKGPHQGPGRLSSPARILLFVITFTAAFFVIDRLIDKGREYLAIRAVQMELRQLEEQTQQFAAEQQARLEQQRRARARSAQGQWLQKNCQDWRRAHREIPGPTSREEMERACGEYEEFVNFGMVPIRARLNR